MANIGWLLHRIIWGSTLTLLTTIHAMPPPSPVQCNKTGCTLYNSYGVWGDRKDCHVPKILYPTTEEELRLAVANANKNKLKVKVVSKFSHTIPKLACPSETRSGNSILISTEKYNSTIKVDAANLAVTADSGVGLRALIDRVEEAGLSLVAAPYWEGVSVGGLISTGAHGSSWWGKGGAVHDHVVGLSLIVPAKESEGYAKIIRFNAQDPLLNAAKVSLGMLGVISKVETASQHVGPTPRTQREEVGKMDLPDKGIRSRRGEPVTGMTHESVESHIRRVPEVFGHINEGDILTRARIQKKHNL